MMLTATALPDAYTPIIVAVITGLAAIIGVAIANRAPRPPDGHESHPPGALTAAAAGTANIALDALELVEDVAAAGRRLADTLEHDRDAARKLAAALEAERNACHDDRLVLLTLAEDAGLEHVVIHSIRQRLTTN